MSWRPRLAAAPPGRLEQLPDDGLAEGDVAQGLRERHLVEVLREPDRVEHVVEVLETTRTTRPRQAARP